MAWYPEEDGTNNLKIDYFIAQTIEKCVADILLLAGIFASETEKDVWLASEYIVKTEQKINRVWFDIGCTAFEAIRLLAEVALYDFYFDATGNPIFKPRVIGDGEDKVDTLLEADLEGYEVEQSNAELHTHIIVTGEGYE